MQGFYSNSLFYINGGIAEPDAGEGLSKAVPFFEKQFLTDSFDFYHSFSVIVAQPLSFTLVAANVL